MDEALSGFSDFEVVSPESRHTISGSELSICLILMTVISDSILNQFLKGLEMTKDAIENVPDSKWHEGYEGWFFSLNSYHIVETLAFYIQSEYEGWVWGTRAGFSWDNMKKVEDDILPTITKELVISYIAEVEENLSSLLDGISDDQLLEKDGFHWFSCVLEKLQYTLRHTAQHCGELSLALRSWDSPHTKWK